MSLVRHRGLALALLCLLNAALPAAAAPSLSLSASPSSTAINGATALTWSASGATGCAANGGWSGPKVVAGTESIPALAATTRFSLTCKGETGSTTRSVTVTVVPAPTITIEANPTTVKTDGQSALSWSTKNARNCAASGAWSGAKARSGSASTGPLKVSSVYNLSCTGIGGTATSSVRVDVLQPPPAPTLALSVSPATVASGVASVLTWSATNAAGCTASGGWSGAKAISGTESTGPLTATGSYTLNCTGDGGTVSRSVSVTVTPPTPAPTVTLSANPATVPSGGTTSLTWSSTNATSCTASGAWSGAQSTAGTAQSVALTTAKNVFTLACTGTGGTTSQSTTVSVTPSTPAPTLKLSANPTSVASGATTTLTWSSADATACTASGAWNGSQATAGSAQSAALTAATNVFTLACTGAGGTATQSVKVTVSGASGPTTGLDFPSNGSTSDDIRFRFSGANLLPMYPATYIWRVNPRQQAGYYTTFFWGPDGPFTGASYYGAHPYPDGEPKPSSTAHKWEISIDGTDVVTDANGNSTQLGYDTWKIQALRVLDDGVNKRHEFYWDLPDTKKVIVSLLDRSYGNKPPDNPALSFGDAPWSIGNERLSGILRGLQIYSSALSIADILVEVDTPLGSLAGNGNVWYLNLNPTPDDIADKSGKGHDPSWASGARPKLWNGP